MFKESKDMTLCSKKDMNLFSKKIGTDMNIFSKKVEANMNLFSKKMGIYNEYWIFKLWL